MIQPLTSVEPLAPARIGPDRHSTETGFEAVLQKAVQRVEASGAQATQAVQDFLEGGSQDLHSVALTAQKSSLQFDMFLQVRNKVVQAYQEVMRMQL